MVSRAAGKLPDLANRIRAWPRLAMVADMFSGAGTFLHVTETVMQVLNEEFPEETSGLADAWTATGNCLGQMRLLAQPGSGFKCPESRVQGHSE